MHTGEHGLEDVHPAARASDPRAWAAKVTCVRDILLAHRPGIIIIPHAADWNRTHLGTHALVMDAIAAFDGFRCAVIETEFWGAMTTPNLMLEISTPDLADLMAALSFHAGEVKRNPYHLRLPAWMQDNLLQGPRSGRRSGRDCARFRLRHVVPDLALGWKKCFNVVWGRAYRGRERGHHARVYRS